MSDGKRLGIREWTIIAGILLVLEVVNWIALKFIWGNQISWMEVLIMPSFVVAFVLVGAYALMLRDKQKGDKEESSGNSRHASHEAKFDFRGWTIVVVIAAVMMAFWAVVQTFIRGEQLSRLEVWLPFLAGAVASSVAAFYYISRKDTDGDQPSK